MIRAPVWRNRMTNALDELALVGDGLALAFGLTNRAAPGVTAGAAAIALRMAAQFLGRDGGHPQG